MIRGGKVVLIISLIEQVYKDFMVFIIKKKILDKWYTVVEYQAGL